MNKLIAGALAVTLLAGPIATTAAVAQDRGYNHGDHGRNDDRRDDRHDNRGYDHRDDRNAGYRHDGGDRAQAYHSWRRGQRFDQRYAQNYREVDYRTYRGRGLYAPPRGYHWVRSGNDAVLVALAGGVIGAVIGNAIR